MMVTRWLHDFGFVSPACVAVPWRPLLTREAKEGYGCNCGGARTPLSLKWMQPTTIAPSAAAHLWGVLMWVSPASRSAYRQHGGRLSTAGQCNNIPSTRRLSAEVFARTGACAGMCLVLLWVPTNLLSAHLPSKPRTSNAHEP